MKNNNNCDNDNDVILLRTRLGILRSITAATIITLKVMTTAIIKRKGALYEWEEKLIDVSNK